MHKPRPLGRQLLLMFAIVGATSPAMSQSTAPPDNAQTAASVDRADRLAAALKRRMNFDFEQTPLTDVVDWIRGSIDCPVNLARQELENEGLPSDYPITFQDSKPP